MTDFAALSKQVSNWGRWGADDELGTLNLIDAAAREARRGRRARRPVASRWPCR